MNAKEKYEYWLAHAQYDLKAANAMLTASMWVYAVFMCQQAVEKLVKGIYGFYINADNVPRVHNISRLVREFENQLQEPVRDEYYSIFDTLSSYYLNNRYPDYKVDLTDVITERAARELFEQTEEVFAWLQTLTP